MTQKVDTTSDKELLKELLKKLSNVSETLFIPLNARARLSVGNAPLDSSARALVEKYAELFPKPPLSRSLLAMMKVRTLLFDQLAANYLKDGGTLIQLGAGLDTRYGRLTNHKDLPLDIHGVEIDFPSVIALKSLLFPAGAKQLYIGSSILEPEWSEKVAALPPPYVFILEGVSMYLTQAELLKLMQIIQQRFHRPGLKVNLLFDFIHPLFSKNTLLVPAVHGTGAKFKWGTRNVKTLTGQAPHWDFVAEHSFSNIFLKERYLSLLSWQNWYGLADFSLGE